MKPKPTMTEAEEAAWMQRGGTWISPYGYTKLIDKQQAIPVKRRRAYTVGDLWELWAEWQSQDPKHRDGAEFLLWLEAK